MEMNSGAALRFVAGALFISNMAVRKALSEQGKGSLMFGVLFRDEGVSNIRVR